MNLADKQTIEAIATDVRYWAEGRSQREDLGGWCAIASAQLYRELVKEGFTPEIHMWSWQRDASAHVFVVVEDHVVDVTATQFKQFRDKPVVIMHCREAEAYTFYQTVDVFKTADALRAHQKRTRWLAAEVAYAR
jgi:hypothetical protein